MHKMIAMLAALTVAGAMSSAVLAQDRTSDRDRPNVNQLVAYDEARIAQLKADLRLKDDQVKDWDRFAGALREVSKARAERFATWWDANADRRRVDNKDKRSPDAKEADKSATPAVSLRRRADALEKHAADLKRIADAAEPLYDKLDDGQRRQVTEATTRFSAPRMADARRARDRTGEWFW